MNANSNIDKDRAKELIESQGLTKKSDINFEVEEKYSALQREKVNTQLTLKEWSDIIGMRKTWSCWLLLAIMAIVLFDFFVILAVGYGWMKFDKGYIVPFFVGESLIKTLGLALIVVGFLFNKEFISRKK